MEMTILHLFKQKWQYLVLMAPNNLLEQKRERKKEVCHSTFWVKKELSSLSFHPKSYSCFIPAAYIGEESEPHWILQFPGINFHLSKSETSTRPIYEVLFSFNNWNSSIWYFAVMYIFLQYIHTPNSCQVQQKTPQNPLRSQGRWGGGLAYNLFSNVWITLKHTFVTQLGSLHLLPFLATIKERQM